MMVGKRVRLSRDTVPWYSGYGANRYVVLPAGLEGTVTHLNVEGPRSRYNVARFEYEGESWQVSFTGREP